MGMFDKYNVFPTLRTKNIVIGTDSNVTIRGLLSTQEYKENSSTWLGTSRFTQYVKICFLVVPDSHLDDLSHLFNAGTRFDAEKTFSILERNYNTATISLDEVLQNDYASSVGESDLGGDLVVNDF